MGRYGGDRLIKELCVRAPVVGASPEVYAVVVSAETDKKGYGQYIQSFVAFTVHNDEERERLNSIVRQLALAVKNVVEKTKEVD
jgi:hypothetical protein